MSELPTTFPPRRQSPVAMLFILGKLLRQLLRTFWPVLLIFVFNSGRQGNISFELFLIFLSSIQIIGSLLAYFKYYYWVADNQLFVKKGVLKTIQLTIPLDRIQTIQRNATFLHRLFGVTGLEIETAGSVKQELELSALSLSQAKRLEEYILTYKSSLPKPTELEEGEIAESTSSPESYKVLFKKPPLGVFRAGIAQNHLQPLLIFMASAFGSINYIDQAMGWGEGQWVRELIKLFGSEPDPESAWIFLLFIPVVLGLSVLYSLVRTFLLYYDLTVKHDPKGMRISTGLLNKKEFSILFQKIQFVRWYTNPLQRWLKLMNFRFFQAASEAVARKKAFTIVGATVAEFQQVLSLLYKEEALEGFFPYKISGLWVYRRWLWFALLPSLVATGVAFITKEWLWFHVWWLHPVVLWLSWRFWKRFEITVNPHLLRLHKGIWWRTTTLLPWFKVQSVSIHQTPYQSRYLLADVVLHTASGNIQLPYIPKSLADEFHTYAMYQIEDSDQPWM